jgi:hypothetical protein
MTDLKRHLIEAIKEFDRTANQLIVILAFKFDLDINQNRSFDKLLSRQNNLWKGNLEDSWTYWFHGDACEFTNELTKQLVYVKINRDGNYGAIDNFYLYQFIISTSSLFYVIADIQNEKHFYEILNELEDEQIIKNIENDGFVSTRILNKEKL